MKFRTKLTASLLALAMLAGMVACNKTDTDDKGAETTAQETTAQTEADTLRQDTESDGEARLNELFANKTKLRFDENGEFRVLILSDLHIPESGMPDEVLGYVKQIVEKEKPALVILNGDNVVDSDIIKDRQFRKALEKPIQYLESQGIYWMHVFGNHDSEMKLSMENQQAVYESFDYCLSKDTDKELTGVGNYVVPVYGSASDEVKFAVWGIDSNSYLSEEEKKELFPSGVTGFKGFNNTAYDYIHFDQIEWYREVSELMESELGHKIPGLMAFHIPLQESYTAWMNREGLEWTGQKNEMVCSSAYNPGLFEVLRQRGDIKAVSYGHDHINDYMVNYAGIKLCYASTVTTTTYGGPVGARMFIINESNPEAVETYVSYLFEPEEVPDLPAISGVIEDFEGTAPTLTITGFDGATDDGGKAEIIAGKGKDGSTALAAWRTEWAVPHNTEVIWDIETPGSIGENKYLVAWMDMATNDIDFRKAGFGLLANNVNDNPYRTDNHDEPAPFYYKAEGSDTWVTMSTGDDGCFGVAQDSSVKGYKGWFAFPLEYMPHNGGNSLTAQTPITGVYFYLSPADEAYMNKPVYIDNIQLVEDYNSVN